MTCVTWLCYYKLYPMDENVQCLSQWKVKVDYILNKIPFNS